MFKRIVFLKFLDRFEVVQSRGKIYFTKYTLCTVLSIVQGVSKKLNTAEAQKSKKTKLSEWGKIFQRT